MIPPTERGVSRRTLLKAGVGLVGTILAGPLLSACARLEDQRRTLPITITGITQPTVTPWKPDAQPTAPTAQSKPPEAQKPASSEVKLSKKPEDLVASLANTPFSRDVLPSGFDPGVNSFFEPDPTDKMLGSLGRVDIFLNETNKPMSGVYLRYTVFSDSKSAKNAYDLLMSYHQDKRPVANSSYPANLYIEKLNGRPVIAILIDNINLSVWFMPNRDQLEAKGLSLVNAGVTHLLRLTSN